MAPDPSAAGHDTSNAYMYTPFFSLAYVQSRQLRNDSPLYLARARPPHVDVTDC